MAIDLLSTENLEAPESSVICTYQHCTGCLGLEKYNEAPRPAPLVCHSRNFSVPLCVSPTHPSTTLRVFAKLASLQHAMHGASMRRSESYNGLDYSATAG
eukprot:6201869-Pleurochrysis_carterae.AAC.2